MFFCVRGLGEVDLNRFVKHLLQCSFVETYDGEQSINNNSGWLSPIENIFTLPTRDHYGTKDA